MRIPIKPKFEPSVTGKQLRLARDVAEAVMRECPQLQGSQDSLRHLMVDHAIGNEPTFHLDDYSEIPVIGKMDSSVVLQQRARLRAFPGDYIASSNPIEKGYDDYCKNQLGIGNVDWLVTGNINQSTCGEDSKPAQNDPASLQLRSSRHKNPDNHHYGHRLALDCWRDRKVRHKLIHSIRKHGLRYVHPHVSTVHVWELAAFLSNASRRPISVIGPSPALSRWANDKIEFTRAAARLLGETSVPQTESAYNFATLSKKVERLSGNHSRLGIKFPHGTGGSGNFLIDTTQTRGRSLAEVREILRQLLSGHRWPQSGRVLIDVWEQGVISSPSVQTWIPPQGQGDPVIEGIFNQSVNGQKGEFQGSCVLELPQQLQKNIVDSSYLLAVLFQQLGYVGRCSFDLILMGEGVDRCRVEFIECNARWGGTSIPMTLMNRMQVQAEKHTWCVRKVHVPGLEQVSFEDLSAGLKTMLFDHRTGQGELILFNPARLQSEAAIEVIAIAESASDACRVIENVLPAQLARIVSQQPRSTKPESFDKNAENRAQGMPFIDPDSNALNVT